MKLILKKEFIDLQKKVETQYKKKIKDILLYTNSYPEVLHPEIRSFLKKIQKQSIHPLKFYLIEMLDDYLSLYELTADKEEEEVFDYWSESEFSQEFMKKAASTNILQASQYCLKLFSAHVLQFLNIHLLEKKLKVSPSYKPVKEIGDSWANGKLTIVGFQELKSIELSQGPYQYLSLITYDKKNKNKFLKNVSRALEIIRNYSPESFTRFCHFTHTIVPIKEKRVVSYSSQKLPGYSTINLYHRDFVDLMDDLIHENGHHHLNLYLNFSELIHEDADKIYYSPWRKALRPIRGIYHAVFTFYWGMLLFRDLSLKVEEDKINIFKLSKEEKLKINCRFVEEFLMLEYSFKDLEDPISQKKMTKNGKKLILDLKKSFDQNTRYCQNVLSQLKKTHPKESKELLKLKDHLKKMRTHYKLEI
ncbi:MAG: aKG-HExxH-type peptide beta-hydroxylase [Bacteriovoracaceae bacterium]